MYAMEMSRAVAEEQRADRIALGARLRAADPGRRFDGSVESSNGEPAEVVIRLAREAESRAVDELRQLDSRTSGWANGGDVLVAMADGNLVAAVQLEHPDDVIADPFRRSAGIARLLEARARQLVEPAPRVAGRPAPRLLRAR